MDTGIKGRTALIAGASRNMGRYAALALAAEGVNLAICTSSRMKELNEVAEAARKLGVRVLAEQCDITDNASVEAFVKKARGEFGGVDIAVNVAGYRAESPLLEIGVEEWNRNIAVNLTGPFHVCRNVIPLMKERRWGRIINLASVNGLQATDMRLLKNLGYVATKHAMVGVTRQLAAEWGAHGITVNAICPGLILTDSVTMGGPATAAAMGLSYDEMIERVFKSKTLTGELNTVEQIAAVAVLLASDAGRGITGTFFNVDGGQSPY